MRVIIVGLGAVGSMAAWRLAKTGHDITVLEQFRVDHDRGSSYGDSRIVRRVYANPVYTRMMGHAYGLWDQLMEESGDPGLLVRCGGLFIGRDGPGDINDAEAALRDGGVPYERVDAAECARRFPAFRLDSNEAALFEPSMGYARASRAVRAAAKLAVGCGAVVREECAVRSIEPASDDVRVTLASGEQLRADRLILSLGPWAAPMLKTLGVELQVSVTRQAYAHLEPSRDPDIFTPGKFPTWIDAGINTYGFPRLGDVGGVKIGIHDYGVVSTPETVDRSVSEADRAAVRGYADRRFPALGHQITYEKVCLYTVAPDNDFVIDEVPGSPRITFISACSGHGFKFAPLMGQIASDLVCGRPTVCDLSPFRLARFRNDISTDQCS